MSSITLFVVIAFATTGLLLLVVAYRLLCEFNTLRTRNANLMYTLSHDELSNPLQGALATLGNIEHRQSVGQSADNPLLEQDITALRVSLDKLVDVMRNLKIWMLLESPDLNRTPKPIDLVSLIQSIIIDLGPMADGKNVELSYQGTDRSVYVMAFEDDLRRAMSNLIKTGIKHPRKQVASYVQVRIRSQEKTATVIIEDNGTGMSQEQLESLGQAPQRPDIRTTGTGSAGLAFFLLKKILLVNNARFAVKSSVNVGTSYTLDFRRTKTKSGHSR